MAKGDNKPTAGQFDDDGFFESLKIEDPKLDQNVNNKQNVQPTDLMSQAVSQQRAIEQQKNQKQPKDDNDDDGGIDWEQRYNDSTAGVEKLKQENSELKRNFEQIKPFIPILETMQTDRGLFETVQNYIEGGGQTPVNVLKELNLPEDFTPDFEDAMKNPDSASAKVMDKLVDLRAQKLFKTGMQQYTLEQEKKDKQKLIAEQQKKDREDTIKKYKLTEEEVEFVDKFADENQFNYEMLVRLALSPQRDRKIIEALEAGKKDQRKRMLNIPKTAGGGIQTDDDGGKSDEDYFFESIARAMNRGNVFQHLTKG